VRDLKKGDIIKAFGEVSSETLKLEKFQVKSLNKTTLENPYCDDCDRSMPSMGADQGYRCPNCKTTKDTKVETTIQRTLSENAWYEVPPTARRHLAKPVVRN
jgi:tRNA(Ile2)-agmatinylcytidine synthase